MTRTGWFECSDPRINQLHQNVVWGMRGNFVGIPTDCPQRDERLGWTGDIAVFAPTATYLYDCAGLLESWLRDLAAEQRDDGPCRGSIPDSLEWLLPAAVLGRCRRHRARDVLRALRRPRRARAAVRQHAEVGGPRARARRRRPPVDRRLPVRRLARPHRRRRRRVRPAHRPGPPRDRGHGPLARPARTRRRSSSVESDDERRYADRSPRGSRRVHSAST